MRGSRFTVPGSRFGFAILSSTLFVLAAVILAAAPRAQEHDPTLSGLDLILDTYVRDGLAFVFAWNTGVIIYDVGYGVRGGQPQAPVELSQAIEA